MRLKRGAGECFHYADPWDYDVVPDRRSAFKAEDHFQLKGHTCGTLRCFWKDALQIMSTVLTGTTLIMMLLG